MADWPLRLTRPNYSHRRHFLVLCQLSDVACVSLADDKSRYVRRTPQFALPALVSKPPLDDPGQIFHPWIVVASISIPVTHDHPCGLCPLRDKHSCSTQRERVSKPGTRLVGRNQYVPCQLVRHLKSRTSIPEYLQSCSARSGTPTLLTVKNVFRNNATFTILGILESSSTAPASTQARLSKLLAFRYSCETACDGNRDGQAFMVEIRHDILHTHSLLSDEIFNRYSHIDKLDECRTGRDLTGDFQGPHVDPQKTLEWYHHHR